ncbi:GNAT family N-acetyltransferase [Oceanirhabdus sp. W0125-5]|uniref:GNAT family N-acetyltransferase n=1 Tax=Oceanirhabdus sp. W0125-5 TaxID=2999116 RepID=UPI0022F31D9E|nr:GNAT family protein [Oceanirhabdus sp. W0125-5]WBW98976.1 GNAT family protein [Oceanirhabdus sp. W0125-5]
MIFKDIETERLLLKNISMDDRDFIFSQFSDDVVNKYLFDAEPVTNMKEADEIVNFFLQPEPRLDHRWILVRKSDGKKMGTCGFNCWKKTEGTVWMGYDMKQQFWGNGYMQEAIKEIISLAKKEMNIKQIDAEISVDNERSIHLVKKFGFILSGTTSLLFRGNEYPHNIYSLKVD